MENAKFIIFASVFFVLAFPLASSLVWVAPSQRCEYCCQENAEEFTFNSPNSNSVEFNYSSRGESLYGLNSGTYQVSCHQGSGWTINGLACVERTGTVSYSIGGNAAGGNNCRYAECAFDGRWNTYAMPSDYNAYDEYIWINYTKPLNTFGVSWEVLVGNIVIEAGLIDKNLTIPSSCWDYDSDSIAFQIFFPAFIGGCGSSMNFSCWNGSWNNLYYPYPYTGIEDPCSYPPAYAGYMYEEAVWWHFYLYLLENENLTFAESNKTRIWMINKSANVTLATLNLSGKQYDIVESCIQESANISTDCGGLNSGIYRFDGNWTYSGMNLIDGNWSNYDFCTFNQSCYFYTNYTIPQSIVNATFMLQDINQLNFSALSWIYNNTIAIRAFSQPTNLTWEYWNGSLWVLFSNNSEQSNISEEKITWHFNTTVYGNNTYIDLNKNRVWNSTGKFNDSEIINLSTSLNAAVVSCSVQDSGYCYVSVLFHQETLISYPNGYIAAYNSSLETLDYSAYMEYHIDIPLEPTPTPVENIYQGGTSVFRAEVISPINYTNYSIEPLKSILETRKLSNTVLFVAIGLILVVVFFISIRTRYK